MAAVPKAVDFVIAGAGAAGLATARYIHKFAPNARMLMVSRHPPMSYTSSMSTECFRNHWPSQLMRSFMRRSIDLLAEHAAESAAFSMNRAGYLYVSRKPTAPRTLLLEAQECHGDCVSIAGRDGDSRAAAAVVFPSKVQLLKQFPFLSPNLTSGMHITNAGWMSAHTMGMSIYDDLTAARTTDDAAVLACISGDVEHVALSSAGRVHEVHVRSESGQLEIHPCGHFINASGPFLNAVHRRHSWGAHPSGLSQADTTAAGVTPLPVFSEAHAKVVFRDTLGAIPRSAPMVICNDEITIPWSADEVEFLETVLSPTQFALATGTMPAGAHFRPYGGAGSDAVLMLWEAWHHGVCVPEPPPIDVGPLLDHSFYGDVVLRGLATFVPDLQVYFDDAYQRRWVDKHTSRHASRNHCKPIVDGGYYTKTRENIPLIGPAPAVDGCGSIPNSTVCGALSGYGIMAAHAAGELAASCALQLTLPPYARELSPLRYQDAEFMRPGGGLDSLLAAGGGQL